MARKKSKPSVKSRRKAVLFRAFVCVLAVALVWVFYIDHSLRKKFDGKKWEIPARVYSRPLELYESASLGPEGFAFELSRLGYSQVSRLSKPGQFVKAASDYRVFTRGFSHSIGRESSRKIEVVFRGQQVYRLRALDGEDVSLLRLEPLEIGGIYPNHPENRVLVSLSEIPPLLGEALIAVEDRGFVQHFGVSPKSIVRAALANFRAGGVVQGGSTITQQLVKNFYLDSRQNLARKALESIMAVLLEFHYTKAQILETYINEVYLGQRGSQGVHGFALASQHYFGKPLLDLRQEQLALLVGLVKGASYYNPWRHPERALARRDLVLRIMYEGQLISSPEYERARTSPLGLANKSTPKPQVYPAFLDLVKRQLLRDYNEEDLRTEGLSIFTTLDPYAQYQAEQSLSARLQSLESKHGLDDGVLEGGLVMLSVGNAEVLAVVGGRRAHYQGFNRALDIRRPIGSMVKPALYLSALNQGYTLGSLVSDAPVKVQGPDEDIWQPRNFSRESHGDVPLYEALASSYNQASARLGMTIGLEAVREAIELSGVERPFPSVPSMLLGSVDLSPLDVAGMYHTYAADGFYTKPLAIRAVETPAGDSLSRYPLDTQRRFSAESVYQLNFALNLVMQEGTGRHAGLRALAEQRVSAGKTGTTNDSRDSWFSGYDGDRLLTVWLGRDDNGKTPLTGGTGALKVWGDIMSRLPGRDLSLVRPHNLEYYWVDPETGKASGENCLGARLIPYVKSNRPSEKADCQWRENPVKLWWKKVWR